MCLQVTGGVRTGGNPERRSRTEMSLYGGEAEGVKTFRLGKSGLGWELMSILCFISVYCREQQMMLLQTA